VPRIEEQIDIAAIPADVFRLCHSVDSRPEWDEQVIHMELLSPPPIRSGTLLRVDARQAGRSVFSWDGEVITYQFPRSSQVRVIDVASSSPFAPGSQISWQFSSVGSSTRLTWVWDYQAQGILARIFDTLGGRASTQRAIRNSLNKLKAMVESGRRT
jgi:hypothetical protein